jgi:hypothetical protein
MLKIKNNWVKLCALILFVFPLAPSLLVSAADDPPPVNANVQNATCAGSNLRITTDPSDKACDDINTNGGTTASNIAKEVIDIISAVTGILAVIMIIYAGFRYVTSGGSDEAVKGAKNTIIFAIVGLVIVAFAQIIVHFVLAKTHNAITPKCVASGNTHRWDIGPDAGKKCNP